jgi:hypothetical protein
MRIYLVLLCNVHWFKKKDQVLVLFMRSMWRKILGKENSKCIHVTVHMFY